METTKNYYNSLGEYTDYVESVKAKGGYDSPRRANDQWSHYTNLDGALNLSRTGWHEGLAKISCRLDEIKGEATMVESGYRWEETGILFDVGTMLTGQPEHWLTPDEEPIKRTIKIAVNVVVSGGLSAEQMIHKGAAVLALIDYLQNDPANIVELWGVMGWGDGGNYLEEWIQLGTTPIDMDAAAFVMAHPAFMRLMGHTSSNVHFKRCGDGFSLFDPRDHGADVYVPTGHLYDPRIRDCETPEGAARWVEARIKEVYRNEEQEAA